MTIKKQKTLIKLQNRGLRMIKQGLLDKPSLKNVRLRYNLCNLQERRDEHLLMFMYSTKANVEYVDERRCEDVNT